MFEHITDAIKAPAIVRLDTNLYIARFETMKVYSTLAAVEHLLRRGVVKPGDTLVDSSSGLYAYSLALACHKYGMKCRIIASRTVDRTLMVQLQILGATVEQVEPSPTLKLDQSLRVQRIQALLERDPSIHWMQQYHDAVHYMGYEGVAAIVRDTLGSDALTVVGAVGSGASTGGLVQSLRAANGDVELIGVQPFGSVTFGSEHVEDPGIIIAGIGSAIPFRNVRHELYDVIHWVSFDYALSGAVALLRRHAIFAGLSSGCCYVVAAREAAQRPDRTILFIAADTGHRYVDSVFARHTEARELDALAPVVISSLAELTLPWSAMPWDRRPDPAQQPVDAIASEVAARAH
ncbi:MAG: pyridoxal-phosphate dependent enzyme [Acidobacteria bacterium]|nr:pyridoxal-phosphate dependent enzyme [Acidobacteriota bacterium]